jgi:hypothetical protein
MGMTVAAPAMTISSTPSRKKILCNEGVDPLVLKNVMLASPADIFTNGQKLTSTSERSPRKRGDRSAQAYQKRSTKIESTDTGSPGHDPAGARQDAGGAEDLR